MSRSGFQDELRRAQRGISPSAAPRNRSPAASNQHMYRQPASPSHYDNHALIAAKKQISVLETALKRSETSYNAAKKENLNFRQQVALLQRSENSLKAQVKRLEVEIATLRNSGRIPIGSRTPSMATSRQGRSQVVQRDANGKNVKPGLSRASSVASSVASIRSNHTTSHNNNNNTRPVVQLRSPYSVTSRPNSSSSNLPTNSSNFHSNGNNNVVGQLKNRNVYNSNSNNFNDSTSNGSQRSFGSQKSTLSQRLIDAKRRREAMDAQSSRKPPVPTTQSTFNKKLRGGSMDHVIAHVSDAVTQQQNLMRSLNQQITKLKPKVEPQSQEAYSHISQRISTNFTSQSQPPPQSSPNQKVHFTHQQQHQSQHQNNHHQYQQILTPRDHFITDVAKLTPASSVPSSLYCPTPDHNGKHVGDSSCLSLGEIDARLKSLDQLLKNHSHQPTMMN